MAKILLKEYCEKYGKSYPAIYQRIARGGLKTAEKIGCQWFVDEDEEYFDRRFTSGAYVGWREKYPNRNV